MSRRLCEEFKWRNQGWNVQSQHYVDQPDMLELVGIRKVLAIPGQEKVAFIIRGQDKMEGIAGRVCRHQRATYVRLHDFPHALLDREHGDTGPRVTTPLA